MLVEGNLGIALVLIANLIGSMFPAPLVGSQTQLAKIQVDEWKVHYDRWSVSTGRGCAGVRLFEDVGKYVDSQMTEAPVDAWGHPLAIACRGNQVVGIYSFGEDGLDDRGGCDDFASWKRR